MKHEPLEAPPALEASALAWRTEPPTPLLTAAEQLARQVAALPGGPELRRVFRTAQAWLDRPAFRELVSWLDSPVLRPLARRYPQLAYKYLAPCLALGLPRRSRLAILLHHYRWLAQAARPDFFDLLLREFCVWRGPIAAQPDHDDCRITLAYPVEGDSEGELALRFWVDGVPVYTLAFTLAAGPALHCPAPAVLLVSRVQGTHHFDRIRQATRRLHDSTPAALLLQAACALALTWGCTLVAGVGSVQQPGRDKAGNQFDYDGFWRQFRAAPAANGLFLLPLPLAERPLAAVKSKNRAQTRRKRQFVQQLREEVAARVGTGGLLRGGGA